MRCSHVVRALALAAGMVYLRTASAAPIAANDVVVYRVGDGSAALGTAATSVFLDEYTPSGVLVQSLPVSNTGLTAMTAVGTGATEGIMNRSQNGSMLVFTGYRKTAGGTDPSVDAGSTSARVIGTLQTDGTIDTTISAIDNPANSVMRSADTVDGTTYYYSTSSSVKYLPVPGPAATSLTIEQRKSRQVLLANNNLYASSDATNTPNKVQAYGALPTGLTTPTTIVALVNKDIVNGIALFDENPAVDGVDVLYALSTVEGKLRKYSFNGTTWTADGSLTSTAQNITGIFDGTNTTLYLTSATALQSLTDTSGATGTINGTINTIATAAANEAFRGLSVVPEPGSVAVVLVGAPMLLRRRRRAE